LGHRVDAIAGVLRISKQLIRSLMSVSDTWVIRVANSPCGELQTKIDNLRCNLKKNKNLRDFHDSLNNQ
jgi:hypothetical protein